MATLPPLQRPDLSRYYYNVLNNNNYDLPEAPQMENQGLLSYKNALSEMPERQNPSWKRKLLSGLVGGAVAVTSRNPVAGINTTDRLLEAPYAKSMMDWQTRLKALGTGAELENRENYNKERTYGATLQNTMSRFGKDMQLADMQARTADREFDNQRLEREMQLRDAKERREFDYQQQKDIEAARDRSIRTKIMQDDAARRAKYEGTETETESPSTEADREAALFAVLGRMPSSARFLNPEDHSMILPSQIKGFDPTKTEQSPETIQELNQYRILNSEIDKERKKRQRVVKSTRNRVYSRPIEER